ncbi:MAG: KpsF/GutQ family sugar-phosphate isomerase [Pseudomonadota bacterium]
MNAITSIRALDDAPGTRQDRWFHAVIAQERDALSQFLETDQPKVAEAIALIAKQTRPVIFTGIGKSGHIAAKLAATFSSLGTAAVFVNAAEAAHGDLGAVEPGSLVVLLSNSGSTEEIMRMLPLLQARGCPMIGIIGRAGSPLANAVDHCVLAEIEREADHIGMAPTSSTTLHLAIGDALAVAVSRLRGFTREDFLRHHPAGLLGRQMIPVASIMRKEDDLPIVTPDTDLLKVLSVMSAKRMGAACVVSADNTLLGLVVDGDVRRHLQSGPTLAGVTARELMRSDPQTIRPDATLGDILMTRQSGGTDWLVLPVLDDAGRVVGMLHTNDLNG